MIHQHYKRLSFNTSYEFFGPASMSYLIFHGLWLTRLLIVQHPDALGKQIDDPIQCPMPCVSGIKRLFQASSYIDCVMTFFLIILVTLNSLYFWWARNHSLLGNQRSDCSINWSFDNGNISDSDICHNYMCLEPVGIDDFHITRATNLQPWHGNYLISWLLQALQTWFHVPYR